MKFTRSKIELSLVISTFLNFEKGSQNILQFSSKGLMSKAIKIRFPISSELFLKSRKYSFIIASETNFSFSSLFFFLKNIVNRNFQKKKMKLPILIVSCVDLARKINSS